MDGRIGNFSGSSHVAPPVLQQPNQHHGKVNARNVGVVSSVSSQIPQDQYSGVKVIRYTPVGQRSVAPMIVRVTYLSSSAQVTPPYPQHVQSYNVQGAFNFQFNSGVTLNFNQFGQLNSSFYQGEPIQAYTIPQNYTTPAQQAYTPPVAEPVVKNKPKKSKQKAKNQSQIQPEAGQRKKNKKQNKLVSLWRSRKKSFQHTEKNTEQVISKSSKDKKKQISQKEKITTDAESSVMSKTKKKSSKKTKYQEQIKSAAKKQPPPRPPLPKLPLNYGNIPQPSHKKTSEYQQEQQALSKPDTKTAGVGSIDISKLSDEQKNRLKEKFRSKKTMESPVHTDFKSGDIKPLRPPKPTRPPVTSSPKIPQAKIEQSAVASDSKLSPSGLPVMNKPVAPPTVVPPPPPIKGTHSGEGFSKSVDSAPKNTTKQQPSNLVKPTEQQLQQEILRRSGRKPNKAQQMEVKQHPKTNVKNSFNEDLTSRLNKIRKAVADEEAGSLSPSNDSQSAKADQLKAKKNINDNNDTNEGLEKTSQENKVQEKDQKVKTGRNALLSEIEVFDKSGLKNVRQQAAPKNKELKAGGFNFSSPLVNNMIDRTRQEKDDSNTDNNNDFDD